MAKKVAVILSGCGYMDGAAVQEAVIALLALDRAGAEVQCFAPDTAQRKVTNHLTGEDVAEQRNVLVESARIARGAIADVSTVDVSAFDAVVLPGGFGAALNLSDFAIEGANATVDPGVARVVSEAHAAQKPIGAICIAPALVAAVLGKHRAKLTIGTDEGTASAVEAHGARHERCPVEGFVVDEDNKIISTPAYMLGPDIRHVAAGIELCIAEVMRRA